MRSLVRTISPIRLVSSNCAFGLLKNDPPSSPDLKSIKDATASSEPIYWSMCAGRWDMVGLAEVLKEALMEGPVVGEDACWSPSCLLNSTISRSISAFLLRFPTLLKLDSILQSRFRRRHRAQVVYTGSVTTSHRSYEVISDSSVPRATKAQLTFCCRHSLHALLTPGCLLLSPIFPSYPSCSLGLELSLFLLRLPLTLVGLALVLMGAALPMLPAVLWVRGNAVTGSGFMRPKKQGGPYFAPKSVVLGE